MTKPALPDSQRRVPISVTLSPRALALLDTLVEQGSAPTRSAAVELVIDDWDPPPVPKRKARK